MSKKREALKLALEGAANYIDALSGDSRKYRQALAEQSHCDDCGGFDPECPLAQPTQGCEFCSHPLYAGTKCKNCGRERPAHCEAGPDYCQICSDEQVQDILKIGNPPDVGKMEQPVVKQDLTPEQPAQQQEIEELAAQRDFLADILTRTANALKGQPAELSSHSWHDLPEVAQQLKAAQQQEPVAWVYPEGLEALKNGKPWTAYGTKQEANNIALYPHPTPEREPYAWVTFTPYGDEDDVWYENPEGKLLEGWTYKPLYDATPLQSTWVDLTEAEIDEICLGDEAKVRTALQLLKEKNT